MKTLAAIEAKNNFNEMLENVQYAPVTIEKNGHPIAVVLSIKDYQASENLKQQALQQDIAIARQQVQKGEVVDYTPELLEKIKRKGREQLATRS